jgi:hypothetical protein
LPPVWIAGAEREIAALRGDTGGRGPTMPNLLRRLKMTEVSSVDPAANPGARVAFWKRNDAAPSLASTLTAANEALLASALSIINDGELTPAAKATFWNESVGQYGDHIGALVPTMVEKALTIACIDDNGAPAPTETPGIAEGELLLYLAKRLVDGHASDAFKKSDFLTEPTKRAEASRRSGETPEQAFARYGTEDPDGQLLLKAHARAPGHDRDPKEDRIEAKADELMRDNPRLTRAKAMERAEAQFNGREGAHLVKAFGGMAELSKAAAGDDHAFMIAASKFYREARAA